jgi:hypothetical protein
LREVLGVTGLEKEQKENSFESDKFGILETTQL